MHPQDKEKTAFVTGLGGVWQFKVMPFGLCNAPATFERMMEIVLQGLTGKICLVYIDDVIVFGKTFEEESNNLRIVFERFIKYGLKMSPKKCKIFQKEVNFLGHVVSAQGVQTDPEKIKAIREWPQLASKLDVQSFVGLCTYYRRFVKNFATIARPLHALTGEKTVFQWTKECSNAFQELKIRLTTPPILAFPLPGTPFILDTDASLTGIGGVLSQVQEELERVICFYSRVLSKTERNYCVTRRELLAIVKTIEHFHHYLYGRRFLIRTDHASLKWLLSFKAPEGQVARWIEVLGIYDFEIQHRPGVLHGNADALSRRPCENFGNCTQCTRLEKQRDPPNKIRVISLHEDSNVWKIAQENDKTLKQIKQWKIAELKPEWVDVAEKEQFLKVYWAQWESIHLINDVLFRKVEPTVGKEIIWQLIVPRDKISDILKKYHDAPCGGHFGIAKTLHKIRERYFWARCRSDVEDWCTTCDSCIAKKGPKSKGKSPLQIYNVGAPFERIAMDILGKLPTTKSGNNYALVISDYFTKWPEVIAIPNQEAKTIAKVVVKEWISRYGSPLEFHTDQGRNFEAELTSEIMEILGIKKTRTTALHPQSDGMIERLNRTILDYLTHFVEKNQKDWDEWVHLFVFAYRSSVHETTGQTPARMLFAENLRLPSDLEKGIPPNDNPPNTDFAWNLQNKLDEIHDFARNRIQMVSDRMKARYDIRTRDLEFKTGDLVWLFQPRRQKGRSPKLQSNWEGPYEVLIKINDVIYKIRRSKNARPRIVHLDRLAPYKEREIRRIQDQEITESNENTNSVNSSSWSSILPFGIIKKADRPITIIIEGNIGSGKSTFTKRFLQDNNILTLLEPLEEYRDVQGVNLLERMYKNPEKFSFHFQHHALMTMRKRHIEQTTKKFKIMEPSIFSCNCFVETRKRTEGFEDFEAHLLLENAKIYREGSKDFEIDMIVYLRV